MSNGGKDPAVAAIVVLAGVMATMLLVQRSQRRRRFRSNDPTAYETLIGETPLILLPVLSNLIQRNIYVKMESMNPGGTGKDRAALAILEAAEARNELPPPLLCSKEHNNDLQLQVKVESSLLSSSLDGSQQTSSRSEDAKEIAMAMRHSRTGGLIVEGTSGSTGIALASLALQRGHACLVVLPDDQAAEKTQLLRTLRAHVVVVPTAAISNPRHYVNVAQRLTRVAQSQGIPASLGNQFENLANYQTHYERTGPEIQRQLRDQPWDAFVMSAGTGGTLAGVATFLQEDAERRRRRGHFRWWGTCRSAKCRVVLVDPPGSSLYNKIKHGVAYADQQQERGLKRHRYDTLAEGIGLDRVTENFRRGLDAIHDAEAVSDQEAVTMAHWLLRAEGLWVGSSTSMNLVGAIRTARSLPAASNVVTLACDHGSRHVTRFWNREFCVKERGLEWPGDWSDEDERCLPECLRDRF